MFKKILLPVDHTEFDPKTLAFVKDIAQKSGSEVVVFHAVDIPPKAVWEIESVHMQQDAPHSEEVTKQILDHIAESFEGAGITVTKRSVNGDPAAEILQMTEKDAEIDLIVMNTHRMTGTKRFLLGSVTNKVVHHAKVPVLVMR